MVISLTTLIDLHAQNTLEFSVGYNSGALKNLEIAPVSRYDYSGPIYKLSYERNTKKNNFLKFQFDYLSSTLASDEIPALNLDYSKTGFQITYLKQIYNQKRFSIHLGLQSYTNSSTYTNPRESNQIFNQSIGIESRFSYQLSEKHTLSSRLVIPVILFRNTHVDNGVYSLDKYQSLQWNMYYSYAFCEHWGLKVGYDFNYDRLDIPSAFREVQYQLNLGVNYKF